MLTEFGACSRRGARFSGGVHQERLSLILANREFFDNSMGVLRDSVRDRHYEIRFLLFLCLLHILPFALFDDSFSVSTGISRLSNCVG